MRGFDTDQKMKGSPLLASFNIICCVVGVGIFGLPYVLSQSGWIGVLFLLITYAMSTYTCVILGDVIKVSITNPITIIHCCSARCNTHFFCICSHHQIFVSHFFHFFHKGKAIAVQLSLPLPDSGFWHPEDTIIPPLHLPICSHLAVFTSNFCWKTKPPTQLDWGFFDCFGCNPTPWTRSSQCLSLAAPAVLVR